LDKNSFKGSDLVKWLTKHEFAANKQEAESTGTLLMSLGYFHGTNRGVGFSNSSKLYTFPRISNRNQIVPVNPSSPRLVIIGGGLAGSALALGNQ
jgi:hypothetical protein